MPKQLRRRAGVLAYVKTLLAVGLLLAIAPPRPRERTAVRRGPRGASSSPPRRWLSPRSLYVFHDPADDVFDQRIDAWRACLRSTGRTILFARTGHAFGWESSVEQLAVAGAHLALAQRSHDKDFGESLGIRAYDLRTGHEVGPTWEPDRLPGDLHIAALRVNSRGALAWQVDASGRSRIYARTPKRGLLLDVGAFGELTRLSLDGPHLTWDHSGTERSVVLR